MENLILAFIIAAIITVILLPVVVIPLFKRLRLGQMERSFGPASHLKKAGTPSMGGIVIILAVIAATLIALYYPMVFKSTTVTGDISVVLVILLFIVLFGCLGFLDDLIKLMSKRKLENNPNAIVPNGLNKAQKIIAQFVLSLLFALYLKDKLGTVIILPFFDLTWDLSWLYVPFAMLVIIAATNSVNLTDGIDGLASSVTLIYSIAMSIIFVYLCRMFDAEGNELSSVQTGTMSILTAAVGGACFGFLFSNSYPAKIIMGDTGSMALGAAVAAMTLFSRAVLLLPLMGICYVASSASSILQVCSYRFRHGKRIFLMAPLHHHFEEKGMSERSIVFMYSFVTLVACVIAILAFV